MLGFSAASDTSSGTSITQWIDWFTAQKQHKLYSYIDHDYMTDRFNLTGLHHYSQYIMECIQIMTDQSDSEELERECGHVYGLIHARYILTRFGLHKMLDKYRKQEFGKCPRIRCKASLLPMGESDVPFVSGVRMYCPSCDDLYESEQFSNIDGAYFGTSFPMMLMQTYPEIFAKYAKAQKPKKYDIKLFGFRVHGHALKRSIEGVEQ